MLTKIDFCPSSDMMNDTMVSRETLHTIVTLSASTFAFNRMQLAHRSLRLTPAQQFMVRCRYRELWKHCSRGKLGGFTSYRWLLLWLLPSGRWDGAIFKYNMFWVMQHYVNGVKHGTRVIWRSLSERPYARLTYIDGLKQGARTTWYTGGEICSSVMWVDGVLHGNILSWYVSGELERKSPYVNGVLHGECIHWHKNGQIDQQYTYVNGKVI